jgi:hypothetical protein
MKITTRARRIDRNILGLQGDVVHTGPPSLTDAMKI